MGKNKKTRYEELRDRAENCRLAARNCASEFMSKYWEYLANQFETEAANIPLISLYTKVNN